MASLYELTGAYQALLDAYDAAETDEERADIIDAILNAKGDITQKGEDYARIIRNVESDVKAYQDEINRMTGHVRAGKNLIERLKGNYLEAIKLTGEKEVKTSIGKWRIQNNPWSCEVEDWEKVPVKYRTPQPDKVDKKSLLDDFKATGEIIEGVTFKQEMGLRFR